MSASSRFCLVALLAACLSPVCVQAASVTPHVATRIAPRLNGYRLGPGDKVRIIVFDEPDLSGEFNVNASGAISYPLIGDVPAAGLRREQIAGEIKARLADGYLQHPQVSIDIAEYRPFFILGEVNQPGEYPYAPGLTAVDAIASAQGFTYRADEGHVYIKHEHQTSEVRDPLGSAILVRPGDILRVGERFF